jgi:ribosome modulation factor
VADKITPPASNTLTPNDLLQIQTELRAAQRAIDAATGSKRAILKRAKGMGADLQALALLQRFARMDEDEAQALAKTFIKYATWAELGAWSQAEMFAAIPADGPTEKAREQHDVARAYDDGYHTGKDAGDIDANPHAHGSEHHQQWVVGWHAGQATNAPAEGVTTASTRRGRKPSAAAQALN